MPTDATCPPRDRDVNGDLDRDLGVRLARIALGHVRREFPHKPDQILVDRDGLRAPRDRHPIFFGSFDWHSCVHAYWMLARLTRLYPDMAPAQDVAALFDAMLTTANVDMERRTIDAPEALGFERPYGWAWLLKLAAELAIHPERRWVDSLAPLTDIFARRFAYYLPKLATPVRSGSHHNTAFALRLAADWADVGDHPGLARVLAESARRFYARDLDCPAWGEPGGEDFLSPTLIEAECMRRHLAAEEFQIWFDAFLPSLARQHPRALFIPALVSDPSDGRIAHLDGLNLSRAWCLRALADALPLEDTRRAIMVAAARRNVSVALPHLSGDYMGEHWLATYVVLALTE